MLACKSLGRKIYKLIAREQKNVQGEGTTSRLANEQKEGGFKLVKDRWADGQGLHCTKTHVANNPQAFHISEK